eukprot:PLAT11626.5.p1 GENE.PLAT11626.5~~PLAT11626.5.p1  ORF type:complete len:120 (+),score=5.85 PLAT11626.5:402-761(+)
MVHQRLPVGKADGNNAHDGLALVLLHVVVAHLPDGIVQHSQQLLPPGLAKSGAHLLGVKPLHLALHLLDNAAKVLPGRLALQDDTQAVSSHNGVYVAVVASVQLRRDVSHVVPCACAFL